MVLAAMLWGSIGVYVTWLDGAGLGVLAIAFFRSLGTFAAGGAWLVLRQRPHLAIARRDWAFFALYGLGALALAYVLFNVSVLLNGMTTATFLLYAAPAVVVIAARWLLGEALGAGKLLGLFVSLAGVALLTGVVGGGGFSPIGTAVGLANAVAFAAITLLGKRALATYTPLTVVVYSNGFASLYLLLAQWLMPGGLPGLLAPDARAWLLLLAVGLLPGFLASLLYNVGLSRIEAGTASVLATMEPLTAGVLAFGLFGERLTLLQWAGGALILTAAVALQRLRPGAN